MYKDRSFLAIIPARGGSKGLPGKNIRDLCGKPMIGWSIEAALNSRYIDTVTVSTDDRAIADIAERFGAEVPFLRPEHLATDTATTFDAVKYTIDWYREQLGKTFEYIVLLEPTSPLREEGDIDRMIAGLVDEEEAFDSIVSIGEVHEHPSIMKRKAAHKSLMPFCDELQQTTRRQDNEPAYFPYGVAYIIKTDVLLAEETFYSNRNTYYEIKRYQCYEVDDIYDFLAIENIMKHEWSL